QRDVVAGDAKLALHDVEEAVHLVAAAVWQQRVGRRSNAEWREIGRRDGEVVRGGEVLQPPLEVSDLDRHAGQHLLLDRYAELPVSRTHAPAAEQVGVD